MVVEKWRRNHERPQDAIRADYWRFDMKSRFWTSAAGLAAACVTQCALADDDGPRTAGSLPRAQTSITGPQNPAAAQAGSPSWQTAPASAQSKGATGPMGNERTVASKPPTDRDCKSVVTKPDPGYAHQQGEFYDGQFITGDEVANTGRLVQVDLEDLQVRIEQLRCEDQNIKAKLDFLIRTRAQ
jgi:hypothetical protein